jgi:hypothetical protein
MPTREIEGDIISLDYTTHRVKICLNGQKTYSPTAQLLHPEVFVRTQNARDKRKGRLNELTGVLEGKKNHSGTWTVNHKGSKLRIIDANHREDSIESYLARHPENAVEVEMHVWKDLTEEEEREEYNRCANNAGQTTSDFLQQYRAVINVWTKLNLGFTRGTFPINVGYKTQGSIIALHHVFHPYLTRDDVPYRGAYSGSGSDFVEAMQDWNQGKNDITAEGYQAIGMMKAFYLDMEDVFGAFSKHNKFWNPPILFSLFRIWYDSKNHLSIDQIRREFKKLTRGRGRQMCEQWWSKGATRGNVVAIVKVLLEELNTTKTRNRMFVRDFNQVEGEIRLLGNVTYEVVNPRAIPTLIETD